MNKEKKWIGFKEIVLIALLTVLGIVIQLVISTPFAAALHLMMFVAVAIIMVVCGPIYVLMLNKSRRLGTVFLFGGLQALYYVILGQAFIAVSYLLFGIIGECIMLGDGYANPKRIGLSYIVYGACYILGSYLPYIFLADQYIENMSAMGMSEESINAMMNLYTPFTILLAVISSCIFAAIGAYIGYRMMKKHFQPAGVM